jgi:hypothetical protein
MQKHGGIACTRCTETISMQNREEMVVVAVKWDRSEEEGRAQQKRCTTEEWCIKWTWHTMHKGEGHKE